MRFYIKLSAVGLLILTQAAIAAAAPEAFFPNRLYVSGTLYYEPNTPKNGSGEPLAFPVEAWYFNDVFIISRSSPYRLSLLDLTPRFVHAYWYNDTAPDGDFRQQHWVSPGIDPLEIRHLEFPPSEAREANPLWHPIHYRMRNQQNRESPVAPEEQPATGTLVQFHDPVVSDTYARTRSDLNYLLHDDRIVSMTQVVRTTNLSMTGQPTEVMITQQLQASHFDQKFPSVPRHLKITSGHPKMPTVTTFEVNRVDNLLPDVSPADVISHLTSDLQRVHKQQISREKLAAPEDIQLKSLTGGQPVNLKSLLNGKTNLFYVWASWAPEDLWNPRAFITDAPPYRLMHRLNNVHQSSASLSGIEVVGISVDIDPEEARAFAQKHQMPWANYIVAPDQRADAIAHLGGNEVPGAAGAIDGKLSLESGIEALLGYAGSSDSKTSTPFEEKVARY